MYPSCLHVLDQYSLAGLDGQSYWKWNGHPKFKGKKIMEQLLPGSESYGFLRIKLFGSNNQENQNAGGILSGLDIGTCNDWTITVLYWWFAILDVH